MNDETLLIIAAAAVAGLYLWKKSSDFSSKQQQAAIEGSVAHAKELDAEYHIYNAAQGTLDAKTLLLRDEASDGTITTYHYHPEEHNWVQNMLMSFGWLHADNGVLSLW